ncbi:MAG: carboxymuconolactone decarboxylase family protein [Acidimicrobiia bacterium]|nr:carboxymuconolactone decarboxylase family protein [Acidimicrobiia bacterium]
MADLSPDPERRARGLDVYRKVYGQDALVFESGEVEFFDSMLANLFGEVWGRPGLSIPDRRLVIIGVLAAQNRFEILGVQLLRALKDDELTPEQVREIIIQLISYIGYSSSSDLYRVSETAIATYRAEAK